MSNRNRQRGKALERFVAKDLGGRRVGILGQEDVILYHGGFSLECKERQKLPAIIWASMEQAIRNAKKSGLRPGVILHELGKGHPGDIVMIRYEDFRGMVKKEQS